ncbi:uncharacterized protein LOC113240177 [Hyposmocoma kahamanoa]|uniref:uncharacterized protein LOC113239968 n=1 Tax=Hyposmocoma kahamanoa TaxID=1477025 RepID=UPI000E6D6297|nr:uncharacterized protein LOC113239968 [Hyposmocoma kahamanoa]XP_026333201.1 uncharacterized protein LOC113240177 [Hyposmocoma kahamanoa]
MFDNYGNNQAQTPPSQPPPQRALRFDKGYVTTIPGILKLVQLVSNFVGFICIKIQWSAWISSIFYNILYWMGIIVACLLLLLYTFHFVEKFYKIPWHKMEFFYCMFVAITYIILSIMATTIGESTGIAVSFFGFCAVIAYGFDGYLNYRGWQKGLPAQ